MYLDPKMPAASPSFGFPRRADDGFVIAERYAGTPWPKVGPQAAAIAKARGEYEQGRVELAQRREGRMEYLYAIPRKTRGTLRPGYFEKSQ